MLSEILNNTEIVLGSQSPRRKELLASIGFDFEVIIKNIDESVPTDIPAIQAAEYIAINKLNAFEDIEFEGKLIITADTVVVDEDNKVLGKPSSEEEAKNIIQALAGKSHSVFTGVAIKFRGETRSFTEETVVHFENLDTAEIAYYVQNYKPYDKAGSYGIQEWVGRIAISRIEGSYENVMGLPTARLYKELKNIFK